jgi:ribonuclease P protein subunit RPR2
LGRKHKKAWIRDMAAQRIQRLFNLAAESFEKDPELSKRYVFIARKIGMRHRVRIPKELKRRVCKECGTFLVPGANCMVRTRGCRIVTTCLECECHMRIPY